LCWLRNARIIRIHEFGLDRACYPSCHANIVSDEARKNGQSDGIAN
jgi:hypothetical protein